MSNPAQEKAFNDSAAALQVLRECIEKTVSANNFDMVMELIHTYAGAEFDRGAIEGPQ